MAKWDELREVAASQVAKWVDSKLLTVIKEVGPYEWRVSIRLDDDGEWVNDIGRHAPPLHAIATCFGDVSIKEGVSYREYTLRWVFTGRCTSCPS